MTTVIWSIGPTMQGGTNATTAPAPTKNAKPLTKQELRDQVRAAAREFADLAKSGNLTQVDQARLEQAISQSVAGALQRGSPVMVQTPTAPTAPTPPHQFTIRGPNGQETIIGVPSGAFNDTIPPQAVDITIAFFVTIAFIIVGLPLARAFARRMDRKGGSAQIPNEIASQLGHLNQAVDAIALEVERISEGQRFTTRLLSEKEGARQTLPTGTGR